MKNAPRGLGLRLAFLGVAAVLVMAGCTLSGSRGLGDDVTPVTGEGDVTPGDDGLSEVVETTTAPPTVTPTDEVAELSDLEILGTQAAATATAQAVGGASDTGGGETDGVTPDAPVVSGDLGGEISPPDASPVVTTAAPVVGNCPPNHTVAQGETLYRIALTYGTRYQDLATANSITNPDQISVGQELSIPNCGAAAPSSGATTGTTAPATGARTHVVQSGENLFRIALQYDLLWTTLAAANNISNPNALVPGQVLQIP